MSELPSIKARTLKLLKENPLLQPKLLCKLLDLPYHKYKGYINNLKHEWKNSLRFELGSKAQPRPSFHNARGWVYVNGLNLDRQDAVKVGWVQSRSRNKALIWKDREGFGRMEWFLTGRVNLFVRKPALKGRVYQLFCNGFSLTGLIDSMQVLSVVLDKINLKAAHAVFDMGEKLPYFVIDLFKLSNGVIIKSGDATHPTAIEVQFCYPDWAEKNERLLAQINTALQPPEKPKLETGSKDLKYVS